MGFLSYLEVYYSSYLFIELGPGASKQGDYKNPEYFQYHNMSYVEMEVRVYL
jgi:hypothetical protein